MHRHRSYSKVSTGEHCSRSCLSSCIESFDTAPLWSSWAHCFVIKVQMYLCRRLPGCHQTTCLLAEAVQHPTAVRGTDVLPRLASSDDSRQLRLAARWQDVQRYVSEQAGLSPGAIAYALYRLGCLFTYMSWQRRAGQPP